MRKRLFEADEEENEDDSGGDDSGGGDEGEVQDPVEQNEESVLKDTAHTAPHSPEPLGDKNQPVLTDEKFMPVQDGGVPQNAAGIASGQFDALDPVGQAEIKYEQGNFEQVKGLPKVAADKTAQLTQTLVPLIEVAMIELLGSNTMYRRTMGNCQPAFDDKGQISIEFNFQYVVESWIGQDIELEAIQHDANYILEKIKPVKANISKCEISVSDGLLTIMGTI